MSSTGNRTPARILARRLGRSLLVLGAAVCLLASGTPPAAGNAVPAPPPGSVLEHTEIWDPETDPGRYFRTFDYNERFLGGELAEVVVDRRTPETGELRAT